MLHYNTLTLPLLCLDRVSLKLPARLTSFLDRVFTDSSGNVPNCPCSEPYSQPTEENKTLVPENQQKKNKISFSPDITTQLTINLILLQTTILTTEFHVC